MSLVIDLIGQLNCHVIGRNIIYYFCYHLFFCYAMPSMKIERRVVRETQKIKNLSHLYNLASMQMQIQKNCCCCFLVGRSHGKRVVKTIRYFRKKNSQKP